MEMTREDAVEFFKERSRWLSQSWGMSPEGREYNEKFGAAIRALEKSYICEGQLERECGDMYFHAELTKEQANELAKDLLRLADMMAAHNTELTGDPSDFCVGTGVRNACDC